MKTIKRNWLFLLAVFTFVVMALGADQKGSKFMVTTNDASSLASVSNNTLKFEHGARIEWADGTIMSNNPSAEGPYTFINTNLSAGVVVTNGSTVFIGTNIPASASATTNIFGTNVFITSGFNVQTGSNLMFRWVGGTNLFIDYINDSGFVTSTITNGVNTRLESLLSVALTNATDTADIGLTVIDNQVSGVLSNTGVTAATYSNVTFVVDAKGRITDAYAGPPPLYSYTETDPIFGGWSNNFHAKVVASITNVPASAVLRVDKSGNDSTAVRGDWSKPYLTFDAALAALQAGDTILVGPGEFIVGTENAELNGNLAGAGMGTTTLVLTNSPASYGLRETYSATNTIASIRLLDTRSNGAVLRTQLGVTHLVDVILEGCGQGCASDGLNVGTGYAYWWSGASTNADNGVVIDSGATGHVFNVTVHGHFVSLATGGAGAQMGASQATVFDPATVSGTITYLGSNSVMASVNAASTLLDVDNMNANVATNLSVTGPGSSSYDSGTRTWTMVVSNQASGGGLGAYWQTWGDPEAFVNSTNIAGFQSYRLSTASHDLPAIGVVTFATNTLHDRFLEWYVEPSNTGRTWATPALKFDWFADQTNANNCVIPIGGIVVYGVYKASAFGAITNSATIIYTNATAINAAASLTPETWSINSNQLFNGTMFPAYVVRIRPQVLATNVANQSGFWIVKGSGKLGVQ